MILRNIYDKQTLAKKIQEEKIPRVEISFYKYFPITEPQEFRNFLYKNLFEISTLGRIYIAKEGINAQISIPETNIDSLREFLDTIPELKDIRLNFAISSKQDAFLKLTIKVRKKIVHDGIEDQTFHPENSGTHLKPLEFHHALSDPETIVVDMRNNYEWEVGYFENAILPDADTFREELPMVENLLKDKKDKKILMYCTGGIRCEKASAYMKWKGFTNVFQLEGGIINYANEIKKQGLESKFIGKNFVFDERLGESVTEHVLGKCYTCETPTNDHTDCANDACHALYLQCSACKEKFENCCSEDCQTVLHLDAEKQLAIRREEAKRRLESVGSHKPYTKRVRKEKLESSQN